MNIETQAGAPIRQAALTLHGLASSDCEWILAALPSAHRAALQPLLDELKGLGIPRGSHVLPASTPVSPVAQAPAAEADLSALVAVLRQEPPQLVGQILAAKNWAWCDRVIATLGVPVAGDTAPPAPALREALVALVEKQIAQAPNPPEPAAPTRSWKSWLRARGAV